MRPVSYQADRQPSRLADCSLWKPCYVNPRTFGCEEFQSVYPLICGRIASLPPCPRRRVTAGWPSFCRKVARGATERQVVASITFSVTQCVFLQKRKERAQYVSETGPTRSPMPRLLGIVCLVQSRPLVRR